MNAIASEKIHIHSAFIKYELFWNKLYTMLASKQIEAETSETAGRNRNEKCAK